VRSSSLRECTGFGLPPKPKTPWVDTVRSGSRGRCRVISLGDLCSDRFESSKAKKTRSARTASRGENHVAHHVCNPLKSCRSGRPGHLLSGCRTGECTDDSPASRLPGVFAWVSEVGPGLRGGEGWEMKLLSISVSMGKEVPYMDRTVTTGNFKEPVRGRVMLRTLNLDGDRQH